MSAPPPPPKAPPTTTTTSRKRKVASNSNTTTVAAAAATSAAPTGGDIANSEPSTDATLEQRKRDKKRVQNRLSQQCYREKQASYIRQLERFVESIQSGTGSDGSNHAAGPGQGSEAQERVIREMQGKQLRLMKENQELREAILRMRKKLLSLSSAAGACADDVIFERILNGPPAGEEEDEPQVKKDEDMDDVRERLDIDTGMKNRFGMQDFGNGQQLPTSQSMAEDVGPGGGMAMNSGMNGTMGNNMSNGMNGGIQNAMDTSMQDSIQSSIQNIQNSLQETINNSMQTSMQNIQNIQNSLQQSTINNMMQNSIEASLQNSMNESINNFSHSINASNHIPISNGMNPSVNHHIDHLSMSAARIAALTHSSDLGPMPAISGSSTPAAYGLLSQMRGGGGGPNPDNANMLPPDPRFSSSIPPSIPQSSLPYYPMPTRDYLKHSPSIDYNDAVLDAIESSIRDVMGRMRFSHFKDIWNAQTSPRAFNDNQVAEIDHMTLSDVCKAALRLLLKCSSLEKYIYAVGTAPVIEKILRWRIAPTVANKLAIPPPFRPTPLQQISVTRHTSIDFIHWGELRDQLIIYQGTYDMQRLLKDSLDCLVREVPHLGISLPVLEVYTYLAETSSAVGAAEDQQIDPVSPALSKSAPGNGISSTPTTTSTSESGVNHLGSKSTYDPNIPYSPNTPTTVQLARKYGLDRVHERKLAPVFGRKWGFLDVSSITTRFPVVRARELARWEAVGFVRD